MSNVKRTAEKLVQAEVLRFEYDFDRHAGRLYMAQGDCADMSGAIRFFERIDPDVRRIETFTGPVPDTTYVRDGADWHAINADQDDVAGIAEIQAARLVWLPKHPYRVGLVRMHFENVGGEHRALEARWKSEIGEGETGGFYWLNVAGPMCNGERPPHSPEELYANLDRHFCALTLAYGMSPAAANEELSKLKVWRQRWERIAA
ncbi:MAG: hypothetical protein JSS20_16650 [Proteobacteria bacterium]|nr:hypothetical protein [Pseudomonadota bacterium]